MVASEQSFHLRCRAPNSRGRCDELESNPGVLIVPARPLAGAELINGGLVDARDAAEGNPR